MFNVLIRKNEQFDQNLYHIKFFDIYFLKKYNKQKVKLSRLLCSFYSNIFPNILASRTLIFFKYFVVSYS